MPLFRNLFNAGRRMYRRAFNHNQSARVSDAMVTLQNVRTFQNLPNRALSTLAEAMHRRKYRRDEFIYYERDPGLGLYIVQRGRVRLLTEDEEGTAHELRMVNEQETFGALSLFGDFRRMETAQAVTETQLLGFFRPDLRTMVKRNPRSGAAVLMALSRYLAGRQAELLQVIVEKESKVAAMRTLDEAVQRIEYH